MSLVLTTPPTVEPVSVAELATQLRIGTTESAVEADLLSGYIKAARERLEVDTRRAFITQTWTLTLDNFPGRFVLPRPPLQSVTSVKYYDTDGNLQTVDAADYRVDIAAEPGVVDPAYSVVWPSAREMTNSIAVVYVAGYGAGGTNVPQPLRQAVLMLAGTYYRSRESVSSSQLYPIPDGVMSLIWPYRIFTVDE